MFNKILIANRGEIALRIIRACKELGIKTVAVHSTVDRDSLHVSLADEAMCIGPAESYKSYLHIPAILSVAEITGADAIHPGYGFLAENAHFIEVCNSCNIKFIGPTPENVATMGNKAKARNILGDNGIPTLPGSREKMESLDDALKIATGIGYPLMIKSAAGGGGRGIKILRNEGDLKNYYSIVQSEAFTAFGDSGVYLEKYIESPKHIEIQILCDDHGNKVYFPERDCSIQRRHQKLLEESTSPIISAKTRKEMGETSLKIAEIVGYKNVGTVEYLLDETGNFYFIEVNTRIQVEHPVTEMITGVDMIKEQIKVAAGNKLDIKHVNNGAVPPLGCSIECRINAEEPFKFIPSSGHITYLNLPGGPGVRIDSAIYHGITIHPYYDSLIAKLIVQAHNRQEAISRMNRALEEFKIEGINTNIELHKRILIDDEFIEGKYTTGFIENLLKKGGIS